MATIPSLTTRRRGQRDEEDTEAHARQRRQREGGASSPGARSDPPTPARTAGRRRPPALDARRASTTRAPRPPGRDRHQGEVGQPLRRVGDARQAVCDADQARQAGRTPTTRSGTGPGAPRPTATVPGNATSAPWMVDRMPIDSQNGSARYPPAGVYRLAMTWLGPFMLSATHHAGGRVDVQDHPQRRLRDRAGDPDRRDAADPDRAEHHRCLDPGHHPLEPGAPAGPANRCIPSALREVTVDPA